MHPLASFWHASSAAPVALILLGSATLAIAMLVRIAMLAAGR